MNITTQPVSFLPVSAAQPTDVLRRDNTQREVITPLKPNQAFHRERGLGSDSDRRAPVQERSYAQQLAQARVEAGLQQGLQQSHVERDDEPVPVHYESFTESAQGWAPLISQNSANHGPSTTLTYRDNEGRFQTSLSLDAQGAAVEQTHLARGERIEHYYQSSYRPAEHFLLGVA